MRQVPDGRGGGRHPEHLASGSSAGWSPSGASPFHKVGRPRADRRVDLIAFVRRAGSSRSRAESAAGTGWWPDGRRRTFGNVRKLPRAGGRPATPVRTAAAFCAETFDTKTAGRALADAD